VKSRNKKTEKRTGRMGVWEGKKNTRKGREEQVGKSFAQRGVADFRKTK